MPTFADIEQKKSELVRKALGGALFVGSTATSALITNLTTGTSADLVDVTATPYNMVEAGLMTTDGYTMSENTERSEIRSAFRLSVTRTDITQRTETIAATLQETSALTIAMLNGLDVEDLEPNATTGELSIPRSEVPSRKFYRLLALAVDLTEDGEFYIAKYWPRVELTEVGDTAVNNGDEAYTYAFTFTSTVDSGAGYASRSIFGGPGAKGLATSMGL